MLKKAVRRQPGGGNFAALEAARMNNYKRNFFAMIPHLVDDSELSVYAYRLYGHIKRRAGEERSCTESARNMAEKCQMSTAMVNRAKKELEQAGLIRIVYVKNPSGGRAFHRIKPLDIWAENEAHYQGTLSQNLVTDDDQETTTVREQTISSSQATRLSQDVKKNQQIKTVEKEEDKKILDIYQKVTGDFSCSQEQAGTIIEVIKTLRIPQGDLYKTLDRGFIAWKKSNPEKDFLDFLRDCPRVTN